MTPGAALTRSQLPVLSVAALCGAVTATLVGTLLGLQAGQLNSKLAVTSLALGLLAALVVGYAVRRTRLGAPQTAASDRVGFWGAAVLAVFAFYISRTFLWHVVDAGGDYLAVGSSYNHGDFSLHLALVRHLASGAAFWPESLLLAGHKMAYPLGTDLFHALLLLAGLPVLAGFAWIGLASGAVTLQLLWKWGGAFAVATFLFAGGLQVGGVLSKPGLRDLMADWDWKSIPLALFATQRGLLFALPAGLALLASWRSRCMGDKAGLLLPWAIEWLLYASLPLFHVHTFLFVSLAMAAFLALAPCGVRLHLLVIGLASFLPASALVWLVVDIGGGQAESIGWHPGWMQGDTSPLLYWAMNFGLWLPLIAVTLVVAFVRWLPRDGGGEASADLAVAATASSVFLACCFFRFAPWEWDNTKLMLWSFVVMAPVAWRLVLAPLNLLWRVPALVTLLATGAISLAGGLQPLDQPNKIAKSEETDRVARLLDRIPPDARIAAAPEWNHPVILAGYKLALGYDGHLWSHGYDYAAHAVALDALMRGYGHWQTSAKLLDADYIFWGPREQNTFGHSTKTWIFDAQVVASDPDYGVLYKLKSP